jgi:hypothetical protein
VSEDAKKPLFWLAYYSGDEIGGVVVIESDSLIAARMNTLSSRVDDGFTFAGGHALDAEQTALVPRHAIGRMLTLVEAERLLSSFEARKTLTKPKSWQAPNVERA